MHLERGIVGADAGDFSMPAAWHREVKSDAWSISRSVVESASSLDLFACYRGIVAPDPAFREGYRRLARIEPRRWSSCKCSRRRYTQSSHPNAPRTPRLFRRPIPPPNNPREKPSVVRKSPQPSCTLLIDRVRIADERLVQVPGRIQATTFGTLGWRF